MGGNKLTDSEIVKEIERKAPWIVCPWCDEKKCVGRNNCIDIKKYIANKTKKLQGIKTTDWLVKGISKEQLQEEKIQALTEEINGLQAGIEQYKDYNKKWMEKCDDLQAENERLNGDLIIERTRRENAVDAYHEAKADNERLFADNQKYLSVMLWGNKKHKKDCIKQIKAEAYKEFAERLKEKSKFNIGLIYGKVIYFEDIDNLLKELAGD